MSPVVDLGTVATATWARGVASHAATITLTVTRPDGETLSGVGTVTAGNPTTSYTATVPTPIAGRYFLRWVDTDGDDVTYTDVLDVWPQDVRMIVSLDDVRKGLNIPAGQTTDNEMLRLVTASATPIIEDIVGTVVQEEKTQVADGGKSGIALYEPASEIVSVTVGGVALTADDYVYDANARIVYAGGTTSPTVFDWGRQNVSIVYKAGAQTIAPNVRFATMELIRHLWQIGHQAQRPAMGPLAVAADTQYTPMGFAVPKRVIELLQSSARMDGFA